MSQEYIQEETEDTDEDRIDMVLEIDPIVETEVHIIVVETEGIIRTAIIMVMEIIDLEMEIIKPIIGRITGPSIEGKVLTKIMAKEIEIEVQVENVRGLGPGIEVPQEIIQQTGTELTKVEVGIKDKGPELLPEKREDRSRSRSSSHVSTNRDRSRCPRCNEYDHFTRECPNILLEEEQVANLQQK